MIIKGTKQLGNFKRGINLYIPKRRSAAAPSGINVATTNAIVLSGLTGGWADLNGTYTKSGDPTNVYQASVNGLATGAVYLNSSYSGGNRNGAAIWYGPILFGSGNGWQITFYDDNDYPAGSIVSADTTTVPISGYSNAAGYIGTIILTAAPSGIPVASTSSIVVVGAGGVPSGTYNKKGGGDYLGNVLGDVFYTDGTIYNKSPDAFPNYDPYILLAPYASITDGSTAFYFNDSGGWVVVNLFSNDGSTYSINATNPSTNLNYIPTSNWSPSITITAV